MKHIQAIELLWRFAVREAVAARSEFVEPEHFLEALTRGREFCREETLRELKERGFDGTGIAAELRMTPDALEAAGINPIELRRAVSAYAGSGEAEHEPDSIVHRSERMRAVWSQAARLTAETRCPGLHAVALFVAILTESESPTAAMLRQKGVDPNAICKTVLDQLQGEAPAAAAEPAGRSAGPETPRSESILDRFGRDLTQAARDGLLSPVIGRRKEMLQVIQTLARSTKSNPVLVGEAGVGKTAIVEGIAQRCVDDKDTRVLGGKRIVEITMGALVAGTKFRGEFEARVKRLIDEAKSQPDLILFIDEIHTMVGAGAVAGGMDAGNLLKPALARGEIKCIGATTLDEYRKHIEKDPALERRFDRIPVPEPTRDEAVEILEGLRPRFEKHHHARIDKAAILAAVDLSVRFDTAHRLPDKAIDLLDLACAQLCVPELSIEGQLDGEAKPAIGEVSPAAVVAVLSEKMGIPEEVVANEIGGGTGSKLADLREELRQRVIGQDEAVDRVCKRLQLAHAALDIRRGPMGVFLFVGPSGVGKTELARALADGLFGSERNLIRLDMSEYMEQHSVARLIGSPPGYVGYEEEGQLTGKLRTTPYATVLLDEVEKAHPRVHDLFLQLFDDGRITDNKGRVVDARNAIFIMTSNIGGGPARKKPLGFGADGEKEAEAADDLQAEIRKHFRMELINRMDEIIRFRPLSDDAFAQIAKKILARLIGSVWNRYDIALEIDEKVIPVLCSASKSDDFGARRLQRAIQDSVEMPLAGILAQGAQGIARIQCGVDLGKVVVQAPRE